VIDEYIKSGAYFDGIRSFITNGDKGENPYGKANENYAVWEDGVEEAKFYGGWGFYNIFDKASSLIDESATD